MSDPKKETNDEATLEEEVIEVETEALPDEEPVVVEEEAEPPSPEELLQAEVDNFKDKWLRAVAETENLRKRSRRELTDSRRFAQADILRSFLVVQDNMERALQSMDAEGAENDVQVLREGVEMIVNSFHGVLKDKGVSVIEAKGSEFDPAVHEAIGQMPSEDMEADQVLEVVQQGYKFGDMVLRAARVIVSG